MLWTGLQPPVSPLFPAYGHQPLGRYLRIVHSCKFGNAAEWDRFDCGTGNDTVRADPTDRISSSCENVNLTGEDLLPDLGMAQLADIRINDTGTQKQLRFSTTIVNVGAGKFEVTGRRPGTNTSEMTTTQRIFNSVGDYHARSTPATFIYSGDGHEHWHVKDLEDYDLFQLDASGNVVEPTVAEQGNKVGFCFFDNANYSSSELEYYRGYEGGNPSALRVTIGLSRGWGDTYTAGTVGQYLDITAWPTGATGCASRPTGTRPTGPTGSWRATRPTTPPRPTCR